MYVSPSFVTNSSKRLLVFHGKQERISQQSFPQPVFNDDDDSMCSVGEVGGGKMN